MQHAHPHPTPADHGPLLRTASYASLAVACVLLAAKLYAWWQTDSLAMLSSFTDSVLDVVMSVANMVALRYALKPADDDHRFGHTSIEDIAGLAQCAFIAAGMALIMLQAFERLANPHTLSNEGLGITVSVLALVFSTGLVLFQTYVSRRTRSVIVASDRMHYIGDILFNIGVLIAFALSAWGGIDAADPVMAIVISIVVLWNTKPVALRAFNNLMDREMPDEEKATILQLVKSIPEIRGYHQFKTRYSGVKAFIQLHVEIDVNLSFREAHAIVDRLEHAILDEFPGADVIIHPDPK